MDCGLGSYEIRGYLVKHQEEIHALQKQLTELTKENKELKIETANLRLLMEEKKEDKPNGNQCSAPVQRLWH